jgi:hypothetical protein
MNPERLINRMDRFRHVLTALCDAIDHEEAYWKPEDGGWSIVEIISHMVDTEIDDMRTRVRLTLEDPTQDWPPIDPEGWAIERNYQENDFAAVVARLFTERTTSTKWLRSLDSPDWGSTRTHPKFGPIRAGDILTAWCAHDALHLRQIAKRMYQMTNRDGGEFISRYAGEWVA